MRQILTVYEEMEIILKKERQRKVWNKVFDILFDILAYIFVASLATWMISRVTGLGFWGG